MEVRVEAASDFADLFEVKDALEKKGEYYMRVDDARLVLGYKRETYVGETWVSATEACAVDDHGLTFQVHVVPHGEWTTDLHVTPGRGAAGLSIAQPKYERHAKNPRPIMERSLRSGWTRLPSWPATGSRSSGRTSAASSTWRRCASRRCRCPVTTCRRPGSPGS